MSPSTLLPLHLWCAAFLCDGPVTVAVMRVFVQWARLRWTRCISRADLVRQLVELATCDCPLLVLDASLCRVTAFDASLQFDVPEAVARAAGGLLSPRGRLHRHCSREFHRSCDIGRVWTRVVAAIELSFGKAHERDCMHGMVARPLCVSLTAALGVYPNPIAPTAVGEAEWNAARHRVFKLREILFRYGSGLAAAVKLRQGKRRRSRGEAEWPRPGPTAQKRRRKRRSPPSTERC
jgi:hypothetical protein